LLQLAALLPSLPLMIGVPAWLRDPANRHARRVLLCWLGFGFLFFQIVSNKRHYYLVPLQPACAILVGLAAAAWSERPDARRWTFTAFGALLAVAGVAAAVLAFHPPALKG